MLTPLEKLLDETYAAWPARLSALADEDLELPVGYVIIARQEFPNGVRDIRRPLVFYG